MRCGVGRPAHNRGRPAHNRDLRTTGCGGCDELPGKAHIREICIRASGACQVQLESSNRIHSRCARMPPGGRFSFFSSCVESSPGFETTWRTLSSQ